MAAVNGSIGFAIPVNLVKALLPQLAEKGKVEWGWLGVSIAEVPDEDAAKLGLKEPKGVLIRQVVVGQPADQGGIKANDVVVSRGRRHAWRARAICSASSRARRWARS